MGPSGVSEGLLEFLTALDAPQLKSPSEEAEGSVWLCGTTSLGYS